MTPQDVIAARLKELPALRLGIGAPAREDMDKAGVVPFMRAQSDLSVLLMKPVARHSHLPPPEWQIAKGTRQWRDPASGLWRDVGKSPPQGMLEPLEMTALREAWEETGLHPDWALALYDAGAHRFASASTGAAKSLYLCAVEVPPEVALEAHAETTADVAWLSPGDALARLRPDQRPMLEAVLGALAGGAPAGRQ